MGELPGRGRGERGAQRVLLHLGFSEHAGDVLLAEASEVLGRAGVLLQDPAVLLREPGAPAGLPTPVRGPRVPDGSVEGVGPEVRRDFFLSTQFQKKKKKKKKKKKN